MDNIRIKRMIRSFNKTKDREIYGKLLDINHMDRPKCKCCGKDIIYPQTKVRLSKSGEIYAVDGCYNTIKRIDGTEYALGVCYDCLSKKFEISNPAKCFNVMSESTKFAFNIPDDQFKKSRSNYALSLESFIKKYGEKSGSEKWEQYCKRQAETNTFEYKQNKYGWTKEEFDEYNRSRAATFKNFTKRYGEKLGSEKWEQYCKRQAETKSWEYMVEHFGEEKARNIILQRVSHNNVAFSKISQQLFRDLDKYLNPKYTTQYATKGNEYKIEYGKWAYSLDYYIKELNVCVEFNGSVWHADPKLFKENDHPNPMQPSLTSKDIWEHDKFRENILKTLGIKTYIIWENEYPNIDLKLFAKKIINENK